SGQRARGRGQRRSADEAHRWPWRAPDPRRREGNLGKYPFAVEDRAMIEPNPAWDFLIRACAWFAPAGDPEGRPPDPLSEVLEPVKRPSCAHETTVVWQDIAFFTDYLGNALEAPLKTWREYPGALDLRDVIVRWARCHNSECCQTMVKVQVNHRRFSS